MGGEDGAFVAAAVVVFGGERLFGRAYKARYEGKAG